mgnify:CR=1 FL=1
MKINKVIRDWLLELHEKRRIHIEGSILKLLEAEDNDFEFSSYIKEATDKDKEARRRRLDVTKQIQEQNKELLQSQEQNKSLFEEVQSALEAAEIAKQEAEKSKENALQDLDVLQKRSQTELMGTIVKVALFVILGVGVLTTVMYGVALVSGVDTQIIGSTWSNMFGILLTNAFSIVGTIMGVKYANNSENK